MLDLLLLSASQRDKLSVATLSAADWEMCFQQIHELPDWLQEEVDEVKGLNAKDQSMAQLLSPVASKNRHGVFKIIPTFSFDSIASYEGKTEDGVIPIEPTVIRVKKLEDKFLKFKDKFTRPFLHIDASYTVLTSDLVKLHDKVKNMAGITGPYHATESLSL